jgi:hypothetical protein
MSGGSVGRVGRRLAVAAAAIVVGIGVSGAFQPANAISTGEAVGIGVGAAVLGTALGAGAAANNPYYYPNGYAYPPGYYYGPAQPTYPNYPSGSCWSPYYQRYVPC